jgi:hypothetical protein
VRGIAALLVLTAVACEREPSAPPAPPKRDAAPAVAKSPPSLGSRIAAFDARFATAFCDTLCRCDRISGCGSGCSARLRGGFLADDQVLAARGCRLDDEAAERCMAMASADCEVLKDFGEWQLTLEHECADVVACAKP